jgi:hypothetical protein
MKGGLFHAFQTFHARHEALKKYVHTSFRIPLPKWGMYGMGVVYFVAPIVGGYYVMQWANNEVSTILS